MLVAIEIEGTTHDVRPDRGGVIDTVLQVELAPGWHTVRMRAHDSVSVSEAAVFVVDPAATFGVISDIDDTVMVTALPTTS